MSTAIFKFNPADNISDICYPSQWSTDQAWHRVWICVRAPVTMIPMLSKLIYVLWKV